MRLRLAAIVLLALVSLSAAPPQPRLCWDHDGQGVTSFRLVVDSGTPTDLGLPTPTGVTYAVPLPVLSAGQHTLVVQACDGEACADSKPITVVMLAGGKVSK